MFIRKSGKTSAKPEYEAEGEVQLAELKPGDVLLFLPGKQLAAINYLTEALQSLSHNPGGHYDTLHAAMCVGKDTDGHPIIAHVTEAHDAKGKSQLKYVRERLDSMQKADDSLRAFQVFRCKFPLVAQMTAAIAGDESRFKNTRWSFTEGTKTFLTRSARKPVDQETQQLFKEIKGNLEQENLLKNDFGLTLSKRENFSKPIPNQVVCSSFVARVYKMASEALAISISHEKNLSVNKTYDAIRGNIMNLRSSSSPKRIEAYFATNPHFQHLVYTACEKGLYQELQDEIVRQVKHKWGDTLTEKRNELTKACYAAIESVAAVKDNNLTGLQQASLFLDATQEALKNAGLYTEIFSFAHKHGMSHLHIEKTKEQVKEMEEAPVIIHMPRK